MFVININARRVDVIFNLLKSKLKLFICLQGPQVLQGLSYKKYINVFISVLKIRTKDLRKLKIFKKSQNVNATQSGKHNKRFKKVLEELKNFNKIVLHKMLFESLSGLNIFNSCVKIECIIFFIK